MESQKQRNKPFFFANLFRQEILVRGEFQESLLHRFLNGMIGQTLDQRIVRLHRILQKKILFGGVKFRLVHTQGVSPFFYYPPKNFLLSRL